MIPFQRTDMGQVHYHNHVIADITKAAVEEIDGVCLIPVSFADSLYELAGIKRCPGVDVIVDRLTNSVSLQVKIVVRYGMNIPDTAQRVQDIIREKFEQLTDIDLRDVNVNVSGIERSKPCD